MTLLCRLSVRLGEVLRSRIKRTLTSNAAQAPEASELSAEKDILVNKSGAITTIGINRPEKKNCLDVTTARNLSEALDAFEQDENASVAIIHGIGGNFCAGFDLKEIAKYDGECEDCAPQFGPLSNREGLPKKPLIAAISGYAVGVGLELALMCDLRVVEETALMGALNRRFGIPMLSGGTVRLPAMVGYARAMELILTGRCISAEEALKWGLATRVVACGSGLGQGMTIAQSLIKYPQRSLIADRASMHFAAFSAKQMEEAMQFEKDNSSHLLLEEGVKGAKRFVLGSHRHGKFNFETLPDYKEFKKLNDDML